MIYKVCFTIQTYNSTMTNKKVRKNHEKFLQTFDFRNYCKFKTQAANI